MTTYNAIRLNTFKSALLMVGRKSKRVIVCPIIRLGGRKGS